MTAAMHGFGAYELSRRLTVSLREREIVILRTCAGCGAEYEWGVHVEVFGQRAGFTGEQITALTCGQLDNEVWTAREGLLIRLVDAMLATRDVPDDLWADLDEPVQRRRVARRDHVVRLVSGHQPTLSSITGRSRGPCAQIRRLRLDPVEGTGRERRLTWPTRPSSVQVRRGSIWTSPSTAALMAADQGGSAQETPWPRPAVRSPGAPADTALPELSYEMTFRERVEGPLGPTSGFPGRVCWKIVRGDPDRASIAGQAGHARHRLDPC